MANTAKRFDREKLSFQQGLDGSEHQGAHADLIRMVFDVDIEARDRLCGLPPRSTDFAFFDAHGICVAAATVFALPLVLDGEACEAAAIRSVAVHPGWRGRGLFRAIMEACLAWCERTMNGPVLLYTEEPALYTRFGFKPMPQHRFVGPSLHRAQQASAFRLMLDGDADLALIHRLLANRTPVSRHVAIDGGSALLLAQAAQNDALHLDYVTAYDALIISESGGDGTWTLVDVAASAMPPLGVILDAMGEDSRQVAVLFPPDKLDWSGTPELDDTGLMIRGKTPAAFDRPFILPPTAEF